MTPSLETTRSRSTITLTTILLATVALAAACEGDDILPPGYPTGSGTVAAAVGGWSGMQESAPAGSPIPGGIAVRVTDSLDRPVSGVTVSFSATQGTLGATSGVSDGNGIVGTSFVTAGSGADTVIATIPNGISPALVVVGVSQ